MQSLPVSEETHAEVVRLQELLGVGTDTVVGLALAQFALVVEELTGLDAATYPVITAEDAKAAFQLCTEHRRPWLTVVTIGGRASRQLAELERAR